MDHFRQGSHPSYGSDGSINYDFNGKLSFSWPSETSKNSLNKKDKYYNPLYEYGYGLTYKKLNE